MYPRRVLLAVALSVFGVVHSQGAGDSHGKTIYVSPNTKEEPFRSYYLGFAKRMEERGAANFPKVNGKSLYGTALAVVTIRSTGALEKVELIESTSPALSRHTTALLRRAQPFEPFSDELRSKAARVALVSRFNYTREE